MGFYKVEFLLIDRLLMTYIVINSREEQSQAKLLVKTREKIRFASRKMGGG